MSYIKRPYYYKNFQCISSRCTDSCCEDWEIDIDDDTLKYYMSVAGEFGQRLKKNIFVPKDEDEEQVAHFIQTKKERCPFLNDDNLCDIFINLGEEHLSHICTHHPRFYEWFANGQEAGLGLCCEEVARLLLCEKAPKELYEVINDCDCNEEDASVDTDSCEEDSREEDSCEEASFNEQSFNEESCDDGFIVEIENKLFAIREDIISYIMDNSSDKTETNNSETETNTSEIDTSEKLSLSDKLDFIFDNVGKWQEEYDSLIFGGVDEESDSQDKLSWSKLFWNKDFLLELFEFYRKLEINDMSWWGHIGKLKDNIDDIMANKAKFEEYYKDKLYQYDNLMFYFIFRHFMKAMRDDDVAGKVVFTLISISMIELLDIYQWIDKGELKLLDQINICKLYSKEIEYDEENTVKISEYLY